MVNRQSQKQLECHSYHFQKKRDQGPHTGPPSRRCHKPHPNNNLIWQLIRVHRLRGFKIGPVLFYCWTKWSSSIEIWESKTVGFREASWTLRWVALSFSIFSLFFRWEHCKYVNIRNCLLLINIQKCFLSYLFIFSLYIGRCKVVTLRLKCL